MEIILLKDVEKVGAQHEIVTVKDGYGRNFLIPQGIALEASKINRKKLGEMIRQSELRDAKVISEAQALSNKLSGTKLNIGAKAGTSGKIFGSVTTIQVANAIKEQLGLEIDRKKISLPEDEIKEIGTYVATVDLHKKVTCNLTFEVVAE